MVAPLKFRNERISTFIPHFIVDVITYPFDIYKYEGRLYVLALNLQGGQGDHDVILANHWDL